MIMAQMKVIMIPGMSNRLREYLKSIVDELKDKLENLVYNLCISGEHIQIKDIDIKKIDNDLGYMSLDIYEQKNCLILVEYENLLDKYSKQLDEFYLKL